MISSEFRKTGTLNHIFPCKLDKETRKYSQEQVKEEKEAC